ncbi:MAG: 2,3-epoxybenzoyl-CoA dihydrolase [Blastocatellia bacterium]|nr:2,3-epoxybenzoyl-CoA dihydrolase [Blastocatellia bacterium]
MKQEPICFQTEPSQYRHIRLEVEGAVARILLNVQEDGGLRPGYKLKLNSYDLGVDIELADAVNRLRFEHPEVAAVIITSGKDGVFSAGANIFMLGQASHAFKVNFCKYTNETRLAIEEATDESGQVYLAALNGVASGGGYELALACREIMLVDDRRSAVALPETPLLGVLPGTGGLTRLVDKRRVRRDRADLFSTLAEGIKGQQAVEWGLVDAVYPPSQFADAVMQRAKQLADTPRPRQGIRLEPLTPQINPDEICYRHIRLRLNTSSRVAELWIEGPPELPAIPPEPSQLGSEWYPLRLFRELDDALLQLRFNYPEINLVLIFTRGELNRMIALDEQLSAHRDDWFVREVLLLMRRTLKRLDMTAKSFFALIDEGSCFAGSLLELALAADRVYMLDSPSVQVALTGLNDGLLPMGNGLSRLATRLLGEPERAAQVARRRGLMDAQTAEENGIATVALDELDWDDTVRVAIEERASLSPDALTGMEANLRFAGPETLETKIFGRLSAWQNWIFQRPNAVGPRGALVMYGQPGRAEFQWERT